MLDELERTDDERSARSRVARVGDPTLSRHSIQARVAEDGSPLRGPRIGMNNERRRVSCRAVSSGGMRRCTAGGARRRRPRMDPKRLWEVGSSVSTCSSLVGTDETSVMLACVGTTSASSSVSFFGSASHGTLSGITGGGACSSSAAFAGDGGGRGELDAEGGAGVSTGAAASLDARDAMNDEREPSVLGRAPLAPKRIDLTLWFRLRNDRCVLCSDTRLGDVSDAPIGRRGSAPAALLSADDVAAPAPGCPSPPIARLSRVSRLGIQSGWPSLGRRLSAGASHGGQDAPQPHVPVASTPSSMGAFRASLSLDEANRVRLSLGLRPLEVDDEAGADERVVHERPAEPVARDEAVATSHAPQGPTLGQGASMSARAWIQHARRQAQVHAAERAAQADKEQAAAPREYTSQDTHGLRVAHDLAELDGHERILTLRDAGVLDMEEDELEEAMTQRRAPPGASSGVLDKYDHVETLDAPAPRADVGFRLGEAMDAPSQARTEALASESRHAQHVNLDYEKNVPVSDYDTAFKKRKKKSREPRRVWVEESAPPRVEALVDDDELAASLARTRRQRAKASMKKVTPEMVAQSVAAHKDEAPAADGLLFDGTSNFVQQIVERKEAPRRSPPEHASPAADAEAHEHASAPATASAPEPPSPRARVDEAPATSPTDAPHSAAEADPSSVASVLQYLRSQGSLESTSSEQREHEKTQLQYDAWLHRHRDHADDDDDAQAIMDKFKDYKPDIKIEYHDEFGRTLSTKEAWKQLSHTFHGTAPGHRAQEKRLRRIAEEQRRERMLAGDTSAMTQAFQARSERTGQAHMVLSVGHHDHAPHHFDLGAPPRLAKAPRPSAAPRAPPAAPAPTAVPAPPAAPPAPPAAPPAAPSAAATQPAFKPAFAPAFQPAQPAPAAEGSRVRIALKRKAT